jgi:hypothetical protein
LAPSSYEQYPLAPVLVMMAACEVIVPSGFNSPLENHPSYQQFLESFGYEIGVNVEKMRNPGPGKTIGTMAHRRLPCLAVMRPSCLCQCLSPVLFAGCMRMRASTFSCFSVRSCRSVAVCR